MKFTVTLDSLGPASEASALVDAVFGLTVDFALAGVAMRHRGVSTYSNDAFGDKVRKFEWRLAPIFRQRAEGATFVTFDIDVTPAEREILYAAIASRTVYVRTCFEEDDSRHESFWKMRNKVLTYLEST